MLLNVATPVGARAVEPPATLVGVNASVNVTFPLTGTAWLHGFSAVTTTLAIVLSNSVSVGCVVKTRWLLPTLVVTLLPTKSLPLPLKSLDCFTCVVHTALHTPVVGTFTDAEIEIVAPGAMPLPVGPVLVKRNPTALVATLKLDGPVSVKLPATVNPVGTTICAEPNAWLLEVWF